MTHLTSDLGESTPLLLGSISVSRQSQGHIQLPYSSVSSATVYSLVLPRDSITSTCSVVSTVPPAHQVTSKQSQKWRKSCGFIFLNQALVILELVSLIFYVTLFLYSFDENLPQRNINAISLGSYILIVMIYSLYSLQLDFPILLKIAGSSVKIFVSSILFAFSLKHIILLPAFFFYFFPTVAGICIHFFLI